MHPTEPLTLYGRATSSNVQAVRWTLAELDLPVERLDIGHRYGGTDTAEYRAMNPNGLVPVLRDGDLTLWESAAIIRYLAARYGSGAFWPADPAVRAPLDMWAEWIKTSFGPAVLMGLFYPLVRTRHDQIDPDRVAAGAAAIAPLAQRLSERIGDGPFMAGQTFSFADIMAGHLLFRYFAMPFERADTPALAAYYDRLRDRPAFAEHVMIDYEDLRPRAD